MIMKFSLFISMLGASIVWANQSPLSAGSGKCLSPSDNIKADSYRICCSSTEPTNGETAGGVTFHYTCASWAKPYDSPAYSTNSARECAKLCASNSNCAAASWFSSMGKCYLTSSQIYTQYSGTPGALLLERKRDSPDDKPEGDCKQQIVAAVADFQKKFEEKCQGEKTALEQSKDNYEQEKARQAENRIKTEREECQAARSALEQDTREHVNKCELEKTALEEKLNNKLGHTESDTELSVTNMYTLCPQYNSREFETTGPNGSKHKWRIYCNHRMGNSDISFYDSPCLSPYQRVKETHELRALLWGSVDGQCLHTTMKPGSPPSRFRFSPDSLNLYQYHVIVRMDY